MTGLEKEKCRKDRTEMLEFKNSSNMQSQYAAPSPILSLKLREKFLGRARTLTRVECVRPGGGRAPGVAQRELGRRHRLGAVLTDHVERRLLLLLVHRRHRVVR